MTPGGGRGAVLPPEGWGGSQTQAFSSVKMLIFVAGELWPGIDLQDESPNTSRPDKRKVGELRLCVERLPVDD